MDMHVAMRAQSICVVFTRRPPYHSVAARRWAAARGVEPGASVLLLWPTMPAPDCCPPPCCSGKSTVGRLLSEALKYCFFDTDALIEQAVGKPVPQIFAEDGEEAFRELETKVIRVGAGSLALLASWRLGLVAPGRGWQRGSGPSAEVRGGGHLGAGDGSDQGRDKSSLPLRPCPILRRSHPHPALRHVAAPYPPLRSCPIPPHCCRSSAPSATVWWPRGAVCPRGGRTGATYTAALRSGSTGRPPCWRTASSATAPRPDRCLQRRWGWLPTILWLAGARQCPLACMPAALGPGSAHSHA